MLMRARISIWRLPSAGGGEPVVGAPSVDARGGRYRPMLRQPVLVFETGASKLRTVHRRALDRDATMAIYTSDLFATGHDDANRAAVRRVATADLDLVGLALGGPHKVADAVIRGLRRHP